MNGNDDFVGPVNLGNPDEYTILDIARIIIDMTNSKSRIIYKPLPADDPIRRKPDISLASSVLKWQPVVALKDGLKETIDYFDRILKYNLVF